VTYGDTVQLSYVDQSRDALSGDANVWEEISGGSEIIQLGDAQMNSRAYCSAFNFKGGDQQKAATSRRKWAACRAVNATGCTWPSC